MIIVVRIEYVNMQQSVISVFQAFLKAVVFAWQGHNLTLGRCRTASDMGLGACT